MTEQDAIRFGTSTISYTVVRSARRRRTIEVRLVGAGGVQVAAPIAASRQVIQQAVLAHAPWILAKADEPLRKAPSPTFAGGGTLFHLGRETRVDMDDADVPGVRIRFRGATFNVVVPRGLSGDDRATAIHSAFVNWYRRRAEDAVGQAVGRWSATMGLAPARYLVRDQKRRWGSCSGDGTLRFNWRLLLVDPRLLDYVVVHELAHLVERNHSKAFWGVVERFMPDCQLRRRQLRESEARIGIS